jgi:hypothetical protein
LLILGFFISNFHPILNVVFFVLGDSLASGAEISERSAHKFETPGNYPKDRTQQILWLFDQNNYLSKKLRRKLQ